MIWKGRQTFNKADEEDGEDGGAAGWGTEARLAGSLTSVYFPFLVVKTNRSRFQKYRHLHPEEAAGRWVTLSAQRVCQPTDGRKTLTALWVHASPCHPPSSGVLEGKGQDTVRAGPPDVCGGREPSHFL